MITYKLCYNIGLTYLCELISTKEIYVNTWMGTDHHQLSMPLTSKDRSITFLERSFVYAAQCE